MKSEFHKVSHEVINNALKKTIALSAGGVEYIHCTFVDG